MGTQIQPKSFYLIISKDEANIIKYRIFYPPGTIEKSIIDNVGVEEKEDDSMAISTSPDVIIDEIQQKYYPNYKQFVPQITTVV